MIGQFRGRIFSLNLLLVCLGEVSGSCSSALVERFIKTEITVTFLAKLLLIPVLSLVLVERVCLHA